MFNSRENQVKLLLGLEAKFEGDNEGVVYSRQNEALRQGMRDFLPINNMGLPNSL
jgi:hypothetical protein